MTSNDSNDPNGPNDEYSRCPYPHNHLFVFVQYSSFVF